MFEQRQLAVLADVLHEEQQKGVKNQHSDAEDALTLARVHTLMRFGAHGPGRRMP